MKKSLLFLSFTLTILFYQIPNMVEGQCTASIAPPSATICAGQTATLTASGTGGPAPYSYLWSNGVTTSVMTTLLAGTYTVTVMNASLVPCANTPQAVVTVNPLPVSNYSFSPDNQCCPMTVQFTNLSTGQTPLSYSWDFGDGGNSTDSGICLIAKWLNC